jgi:thymidylate synthase (FAD)
MKVVPIAATTLFNYAVLEETPYKLHGLDYLHPDSEDSVEGVSSIDELAELAGRNCYQSWDRPNPKTSSNESYLYNIISQQHFSVMEHGTVTFYVEGVSRSLLAELTRHRHLSFSVVSQRYVDANDLGVVYPPILNDLDDEDSNFARSLLEFAGDDARSAYNSLVDIFVKNGYKRKQAREAARAVLPNMTDSPMIVTGNIRAWRDVLSKRYHIAADREIQEFAGEVLKHLRVLAPNSVQDINDKFGEKES